MNTPERIIEVLHHLKDAKLTVNERKRLNDYLKQVLSTLESIVEKRI